MDWDNLFVGWYYRLSQKVLFEISYIKHNTVFYCCWVATFDGPLLSGGPFPFFFLVGEGGEALRLEFNRKIKKLTLLSEFYGIAYYRQIK